MAGCSSTDNRYIVRFINCDLVVVQNSETIFKTKELSLCSWFDETKDYSYYKHTIDSGGSLTVSDFKDFNLFYFKITWPSDALESEKNIILTLQNSELAYTNQTYPIKNVLMLDSIYPYTEYQIQNTSDHQVEINILCATHFNSQV